MTAQSVGIIANMKATLIFRRKLTYADGRVIEAVIWRLPRKTIDRPHGYKYRLYYGRDGVRLLGFDNERPKGDHFHRGDVEASYVFDGPEKLIDDFLRMVEAYRRNR